MALAATSDLNAVASDVAKRLGIMTTTLHFVAAEPIVGLDRLAARRGIGAPAVRERGDIKD